MIYALLRAYGRLLAGRTEIRVKLKPALQSISGSGLRRKIFLEFAAHAVEILGVGRGFLFLGDVRPALGVLGIDLQPLLQAGLGVRLDGVGRAFRLAYPAIDAFVRMKHQHVLALVEAVHGADFDAVGIFALDAGFSDDVSHPRLRNGSILSGWRSAGTPQPQVKRKRSGRRF